MHSPSEEYLEADVEDVEDDWFESIKIKDGLYIGNINSVLDGEFMDGNQVTGMISCLNKDDNEKVRCNYDDNPLDILWLSTPYDDAEDYFDDLASQVTLFLFIWRTYGAQVVDFIEERLEGGYSVVIASYTGYDRAPYVALVYLIRRYRWGFVKASRFLEAKSVPLPSGMATAVISHFGEQLESFEGTTSWVCEAGRVAVSADMEDGLWSDELVQSCTFFNSLSNQHPLWEWSMQFDSPRRTASKKKCVKFSESGTVAPTKSTRPILRNTLQAERRLQPTFTVSPTAKPQDGSPSSTQESRTPVNTAESTVSVVRPSIVRPAGDAIAANESRTRAKPKEEEKRLSRPSRDGRLEARGEAKSEKKTDTNTAISSRSATPAKLRTKKSEKSSDRGMEISLPVRQNDRVGSVERATAPVMGECRYYHSLEIDGHRTMRPMTRVTQVVERHEAVADRVAPPPLLTPRPRPLLLSSIHDVALGRPTPQPLPSPHLPHLPQLSPNKALDHTPSASRPTQMTHQPVLSNHAPPPVPQSHHSTRVFSTVSPRDDTHSARHPTRTVPIPLVSCFDRPLAPRYQPEPPRNQPPKYQLEPARYEPPRYEPRRHEPSRYDPPRYQLPRHQPQPVYQLDPPKYQPPPYQPEPPRYRPPPYQPHPPPPTVTAKKASHTFRPPNFPFSPQVRSSPLVRPPTQVRHPTQPPRDSLSLPGMQHSFSSTKTKRTKRPKK